MLQIKRLVLTLLLGMLVACSFERDGGFERQFGLNPTPIPQGTYRASGHTLKVMLPTMAPELDTDRIALRQADGRRDYIADAKWADFLPVLVQSALVRSFANAGRYKTVVADDTPAVTGYVLEVSVEDFHISIQRSGTPFAQIRMRAKLLPYGSSRVLTQVVLASSRPVSSASLQDMMRALDALFAELQAQALAKLGPR